MKFLAGFIFAFIMLANAADCFPQLKDSSAFGNDKQTEKNPEYKSLIKSGKSRMFIAPVCLMSAGLLMISNEFFDRHDMKSFMTNEFRGYSHHMDDYLQYSPIAAAYLLDFAGYKSKNSFIEKSIILLESELMMLAVVEGLKQVTHVLRPDGSDYKSFPSGHTAQAFVAATFLAREYWEKSPWIAVTGYTVAGVTGCMRMMNNKHWVSDVLFGAGVGILCTNLAYLTHRFEWTKYKSKLAVIPAVGDKNYGASVYLQF